MNTPITIPVRSSEPTTEPVTLDEAKKACGISLAIDDFDTDVLSQISAARQQVENDTGIICLTGTFTWKQTEWPCGDVLEIRCLRPVTSVTSIVYLDGSGSSTTWGSSNYSLETSGVQPFIRLTYGSTWPAIRGDINGITLTVVAGYASQIAVPPMVKTAVLCQLKALWLEQMQELKDAEMMRGAYERQIFRITRRTYP